MKLRTLLFIAYVIYFIVSTIVLIAMIKYVVR
jgi:hypothetical protein